MRTIQAQVNISNDHLLSVQLPEDIEAGQYQVVIVMNPQVSSNTTFAKHNLNQLAGKIEAFKDVDAVAWQQEIRREWDETRLSP